MILDSIKNRRSVFPAQYNDKPIAKKELETLLEAANWAPTHKRTEPWRFKVVHEKASRESLGRFLSEKYQEVEERPKQVKIKKLLENPVRSAAVIAICMQRDPNECVPEWEEIAAVAMAVQNMWLCCTEMGIGCYWSSPKLIKHMDAYFDMAAGEKCLGFFYIGYYDTEVPPVSRGTIEDKVIWM